VVVPSARSKEEILPGHIPDVAAREFALRYVLLFDNFTPATIDAVTEILKPLIAPRFWTRVVDALEKRRSIVREGRMATQTMPDLSATRIERLSDETLDVQITARRRSFISDRLSREQVVRYTVTLESAHPSPLNPFGLLVVGQSIHETP